jgi:hypothetical protein
MPSAHPLDAVGRLPVQTGLGADAQKESGTLAHCGRTWLLRLSKGGEAVSFWTLSLLALAAFAFLAVVVLW